MGTGGWTQAQLAEAIGVSIKTVNSIENGRHRGMRENTKAALEDTLGWMPGDVDRVLRGSAPRGRADSGGGSVTSLKPSDQAAPVGRSGQGGEVLLEEDFTSEEWSQVRAYAEFIRSQNPDAR